MVKMFVNSPGDRGPISEPVIRDTQKKLLDSYSLNTQYYKVHIKEVEQSRERSSILF